MTGLLCQKERGLKKQRERAREAGPPIRVGIRVRGAYFRKSTHSASTHNKSTQSISLVGCR